MNIFQTNKTQRISYEYKKAPIFLLSMAIPTFITGCSNPMTWADDYMTQKSQFPFLNRKATP